MCFFSPFHLYDQTHHYSYPTLLIRGIYISFRNHKKKSSLIFWSPKKVLRKQGHNQKTGKTSLSRQVSAWKRGGRGKMGVLSWLEVGGRWVNGRWWCKLRSEVVWGVDNRNVQAEPTGYPGSPAITGRLFAASGVYCALSDRQRSHVSGAFGLTNLVKCGLFMESCLQVTHRLSRRKIPVMKLTEAI